MASLVERLREHATDWDGRQMADAEPAKGDPTAGTLRQAADRITALEAMCETLAGALDLAGNRLHRCCVDYETGTRQFIEVGEWAAEAREALTQYRAMKEKNDG